MVDLALQNARIIDPESAAVIDSGHVGILDGRIVQVAPGPFAGSASRVVDVDGGSVLPGLIDCHVHLASFADSPDQMLRGVTHETVAESTLRGAASARKMLESGVTTVRDLGCKHPGIFALKRSIDLWETLGPRLIVAGAGITMTGGTAHRSGAIEADGVDAIIRAVREQARAGAEVIKVFLSPGVIHTSSTIGGVQYSEPEIRAAVEEARRLGRPIAAHACTEAAVEAAVECGVNSVEHGHEISQRVADAMAARGIYLVPTAWHYQRVALHGEALGFSAETVKRVRRHRDRQTESIWRALAAGVRIVAGTDSGGPAYLPGSLHLELQYLRELGMAPIEVVRSATSGAAGCLKLGDGSGRVAVGAPADIVVLATDPLADLRVLEKPKLVIKAGRVVFSDML